MNNEQITVVDKTIFSSHRTVSLLVPHQVPHQVLHQVPGQVAHLLQQDPAARGLLPCVLQWAEV